MRWRKMRRSEQVEDRRGSTPRRRRIAGGGARLGGGGIVLVVVASLLFGVNPLEMLALLDGGGAPVASSRPAPSSSSAGDDAGRDFVAAVLGDTEDVWGQLYSDGYRRPRLVLFSDVVRSACGTGEAAMGPFYCPGDSQVYIDLVFFRDLADRFGAPGDFAQAYVIAHEVGHHVQNLSGVSRRVHEQRARLDTAAGNALSVRQELQADCYAGVWGHYAAQRGLLEAGDLEEALEAATAIGDDRLQRQARGTVVPESFTHGSSEQRRRWFRAGFDVGDPARCDTFSAARL